MLCPTTTGYLEGSTRTVMVCKMSSLLYIDINSSSYQDILRRHSAWGLTQEVKDNECHYKVVHDRVSSRLTDKRRDLKVAVSSRLLKRYSYSNITTPRRSQALLVKLILRTQMVAVSMRQTSSHSQKTLQNSRVIRFSGHKILPLQCKCLLALLSW
jgi:hypothetical protein